MNRWSWDKFIGVDLGVGPVTFSKWRMQLKWGPPMISRFHFSVDRRGNLRRTFILLGILILAMSQAFESSATAPPWEAKDWTNWTFQDCQQILTDSPWAVTYGVHPVISHDYRPGKDIVTYSPATAIVSSSLVIRQVYLRQQVLIQGKDPHLTAERTQQGVKQFEQKAAACLNQNFDDRILITINGASVDDFKTPPDMVVSDRKYPPFQIMENDPRTNTCTEHILTANTPQITYAYPRVVNGKSIFGPGDKKFSIKTPSTWTRDFEFNIQKLIYKGKPDF